MVGDYFEKIFKIKQLYQGKKILVYKKSFLDFSI